MEKEFILKEIRRIASLNNSTPPGASKFQTETGIKHHEWSGKYWARWGDALIEAGFAPNQWQEGYDANFLIEKLIELAREIGHFPTFRELQLKAHQDGNFPSVGPFKNHFGSKSGLVSIMLKYSQEKEGLEDIVRFCVTASKGKVSAVPNSENQGDSPGTVGCVYLMKSGRFYKIGKTNSIGRREYDLAIQLAEKPTTVHVIKTDDPDGIEAYWHTRFKAKRKGGEWFDLSASDVKAFKRWLRIA
jgi:Meiotically Up-regulated Gene 113 (MUG113) protein